LISTPGVSGIILKGRRNPEYISFKENVDFLRKAMTQSNQLTTAMDFVRLFIDDVVPAMNKLRVSYYYNARG
jgi:hypothetical protein